MAQITDITLTVDTSSINPAVFIRCRYEYYYDCEYLISLSGHLRLSNGQLAAILHWDRSGETTQGNLRFPDKKTLAAIRSNPQNLSSLRLFLRAELSPLAIQWIENLRDKDHEKSAKFSGYIEYSSIFSETDSAANPPKTNLVVKHDRESYNIQINQSDWVNKFANPLGIGKFMLVELRMLESPNVPQTWEEKFKRAQERLRETEEAIRQGDWQKAVEIGRKVFDNLKVFDKNKPAHRPLEEDFEKAFKADNYTDEGIGELKEAIKKLFHFGSKYVHDDDKLGNQNPDIVATKEEAYLMYSLGLSILNLLGSKLNRLSEKQSTSA